MSTNNDRKVEAARRAVTLDDAEWWLVVLGASYEQTAQEASESVARLEALRDALLAAERAERGEEK